MYCIHWHLTYICFLLWIVSLFVFLFSVKQKGRWWQGPTRHHPPCHLRLSGKNDCYSHRKLCREMVRSCSWLDLPKAQMLTTAHNPFYTTNVFCSFCKCLCVAIQLNGMSLWQHDRTIHCIVSTTVLLDRPLYTVISPTSCFMRWKNVDCSVFVFTWVMTERHYNPSVPPTGLSGSLLVRWC